MDFLAYIRLFRKWFWLLLLGAFLAAGSAYLFRGDSVELYEARVTLLVGGAVEVPNPDYTELRVSVELVRTYAVLARTFDILEATVQAGNFPVTAQELRGMVSAAPIENTSLLVLSVTNTDPILASDLANEVARQLVLNSPTNLTPEQEQQIELQMAEVEHLQGELEQTRQQLATVDNQLAAITDENEGEVLREQRAQLTTQIIQLSNNIALFQNNITTLQRRVNSLDIVESAQVSGPSGQTSTFIQLLLGAVVGLALAAGAILVIEYLDDSVRTPEEATQTLALPMLAAISRFGKPRDPYSQRLITYNDPGSHVSEEYRTLRTNLLFSSNGTSDKGIYIVTSPGPSEGKSVTTANLAVTIAMAGWRVLLIDADLRRPKIHEIFGLDNSLGLSTLLSADPSEVLNHSRDGARSLAECLQDTDIPGLRVITSGYLPLNPTEVLGSVSMQRWFHEFRSSTNVDIVLFDSPPALVVADSAVLASAIEVPVVMVLEAGRTRRGAALRAKEQFKQLGIDVSGIVLNAVNPKEQRGYGYGYGYYYYYRESSDSKARMQRE
jgi:succinoglycan biosynthesis transport protein ExoP